jgi:hypothetical protein
LFAVRRDESLKQGVFTGVGGELALNNLPLWFRVRPRTPKVKEDDGEKNANS